MIGEPIITSELFTPEVMEEIRYLWEYNKHLTLDDLIKEIIHDKFLEVQEEKYLEFKNKNEKSTEFDDVKMELNSLPHEKALTHDMVREEIKKYVEFFKEFNEDFTLGGYGELELMKMVLSIVTNIHYHNLLIERWDSKEEIIKDFVDFKEHNHYAHNEYALKEYLKDKGKDTL